MNSVHHEIDLKQMARRVCEADPALFAAVLRAADRLLGEFDSVTESRALRHESCGS